MHVVLVDPSRVVQQKLAAELEASGCFVDCFSASDQAIDYVATAKSVDVVLTSLEIEPVSGLELCWQLRTVAGDRRPLHIIVMSSNNSERALAEALDSGADDFVVKPVRRDELMARLRAANRLITLQRQLVLQAETDDLTGALNRKAFIAAMDQKREELDATDALSVCRLDVGGLKPINERFGHAAGDAILKDVARIAGEEAPIVARLGACEFVLAFPILEAAQAAHWCEVILNNVAEHNASAYPDAPQIDCRFGVAQWVRGEPLADAVRRSDLALKEAKASDAKRVFIADAPSGHTPDPALTMPSA